MLEASAPTDSGATDTSEDSNVEDSEDDAAGAGADAGFDAENRSTSGGGAGSTDLLTLVALSLLLLGRFFAHGRQE